MFQACTHLDSIAFAFKVIPGQSANPVSDRHARHKLNSSYKDTLRSHVTLDKPNRFSFLPPFQPLGKLLLYGRHRAVRRGFRWLAQLAEFRIGTFWNEFTWVAEYEWQLECTLARPSVCWPP